MKHLRNSHTISCSSIGQVRNTVTRTIRERPGDSSNKQAKQGHMEKRPHEIMNKSPVPRFTSSSTPNYLHRTDGAR